MPDNPQEQSQVNETDTLRASRLFFVSQVLAQALVAIFTPITLTESLSLEKIKATWIFAAIAALLYFLIYGIGSIIAGRWKGITLTYLTRYDMVWFYILIIGMITNNVFYKYQNHHLGYNLTDETGFNYLGDMSKTFMISILAFLASNIINQMLGIKDGYVEMVKKGDQFVKDLRKSEEIIDSIVKVNSIIAPIYDLMNHVKNNRSSKSLEKQVDLFTNNIADYTKTLSELHKDAELRVWSFSLLNKYIEGNREYLDKYKTIFIPYSELKSVVSKFMKFALQDEDARLLPEEQKYKFFALFALSPIDFFPNPTQTNPSKLFSYCKWNFAIKQAADSTGIKTGVDKMNRVFISVDDTSFPIQGLHKNNVVESLNSDAHNILNTLIADADAFRQKMESDNKSSVNISLHQTYIDDLKRIQSKYTSGNLTVRDLLKEYHSENCAEILDLPQTEANLILTGDNNWYVKDYFAIQRFDSERNAHVWSYCLAGAFHPTFNAIEINIYHEKQTTPNERTGKSWDDICTDLDAIFKHKDIKAL